MDFAFLGSGHAGEGVGVDVDEGSRRVGDVVGWVVRVLERLPQWGEVPCLLETFNRRLVAARKEDMPARESADNKTDYAADDGQHDVVDREQRVQILGIVHNLRPGPGSGHSEAIEAKDSRIDEEQQEGLVVPEPDTGGEPGAVVVHLEDAAAARGAVVRAVRLPSLAFLAEARLAVGLDGEGRGVVGAGLSGREEAVAVVVGRGAGVGEDGGGVGPVEEDVEYEAHDGGSGS